MLCYRFAVSQTNSFTPTLNNASSLVQQGLRNLIVVYSFQFPDECVFLFFFVDFIEFYIVKATNEMWL